MKTITEDSILVKDYISGNEKALEILIHRHSDRISSYIFNKIQNQELAEDIFQDTFIKVINTLKKGKYNEEGKFLPWVLRIAHNLVIDHFRSNKKMPSYNNGEDFDIFEIIKDEDPSIENELIKEQINMDLRVLIDELPDDQKEVIIMRLYKDMSFKEIADISDVSINTALGRMRYALINLRKMIEKHKLVMTAS
ncbi:MAG: RNA polymerase subunit sigma-24 [Flavobacteriaceae bacterium]|nr:RNA polymerase subunit sigma-24 [Flavobacteriaceae bacterium]